MRLTIGRMMIAIAIAGVVLTAGHAVVIDLNPLTIHVPGSDSFIYFDEPPWLPIMALAIMLGTTLAFVVQWKNGAGRP
jgi:hypothetical protein